MDRENQYKITENRENELREIKRREKSLSSGLDLERRRPVETLWSISKRGMKDKWIRVYT